MDWTNVIERDLRRLSELSKGDITRILGFLHHDACDGKLYRFVRSSFPFNLSSGPPNWGLCRPSEIPSTISLSLSYVYRNAVEAANYKQPMKWTEEHVELYLEATIVSCWSSLSDNENSELGDLDIGTDLLNEISLQPVGQKDSRIWGLWAVLDFLNNSRKQGDAYSNTNTIYNAANEALKRIENGRLHSAEPEALLTAVTTQFTSIIQKSKLNSVGNTGLVKSPKESTLDNMSTIHNQNTIINSNNINSNSNNGSVSSGVVEMTSNIDESVSAGISKPVESQRAAIRYVPSKRFGGRAHVFSLSSTTSTMATTPAPKVSDSTHYGYSGNHNNATIISSNCNSNNNSTLNSCVNSNDLYSNTNCDPNPKTPIPIRRQKIYETHVKISENNSSLKGLSNNNNIMNNFKAKECLQENQNTINKKQKDRKIGFNIEDDNDNSSSNNNMINVNSNVNNESDHFQLNNNNINNSNPQVCKYSLEPAVKYPGYKLEVNGRYYEIISSIQKGGSSQVYKVKECITGELYALKCVRVFTKNHDHSFISKDDNNNNNSISRKISGRKSINKSKQKNADVENNNDYNDNYDCMDDEDEDEDNEEQQLLLMFTEEVNLLKKLRGCSHVIQLIDSEIALSCGAIDIIMELGVKDLNSILQGNTPLSSINMLRSIWTEMVLALKNVHDLRIVHGDIKPANFVFVEKNPVNNNHVDDGDNNNSISIKDRLDNKAVKIIDFGISRPIADDTTHIFRDKAVGSLPFMAPETVKPVTIPESKFAAAAVASKLRMPHQVMSRTADIWSLGAILYRITYKRHLFQPLVNKSKQNGGSNNNNSLNSGKKIGQQNKSNLAPHEILMFLQNEQSKISFPKEIGIMFTENTENDSLWFDALRHLLKWTLQWDPLNRPNVNQLLTHPFIDTNIVSSYIMQQSLPRKSILSSSRIVNTSKISDDYLIANIKYNSKTDEEKAELLEEFFKSSIPLSDLYNSKPKNIYLSSMRWNIVTNGNYLFHSLYESLRCNLKTDENNNNVDQSVINNLAISQFLSLVKEISIPSPPSVNTINGTSKNRML
ncbi:Ser/Thr protein kinase [Cryptosporidium ryanae]|uniref:Ser/Thr protein kinase n=1 Tax=Cryptosporidium ryanae TaxID=515981 RepID=UPI00351A3F7E|nr:Ser/Thr protein kinase [Cryptosporidium ryanae]